MSVFTKITKLLLFYGCKIFRNLITVKGRFLLDFLDIEESSSEEHGKDFHFFLEFLFDFFEAGCVFHLLPFFWINFELRLLDARQYMYEVMNFEEGDFKDGEGN